MTARRWRLAESVAGIEKQGGARKAIMPGPPVFIDQDPHKTEPAGDQGNQRGGKSEQGLRPADGLLIEGQHFYFPCAHT